MATTVTSWRIRGEYFENCNCDVVCPCLFSPKAPMTSAPTEGPCEVPLVWHIDEGSYGDTSLDGLNAAAMFRTPGPMGEGNAQVALYIDDRADEAQNAALTAIFSGAAGGPMGLLAPLVSEVLGVKSVPITFVKDGTHRSAEIGSVGSLAVHAAPNISADDAIWASNAHPFAPAGLAMAVGDEGSTFSDYGMSWDNSGKNAHYAPIDWSS